MKIVRKSIIQETKAMKTTITISTGILLFVSALYCSAATDTNQSPLEAEDEAMQTSQQTDISSRRLDFVKMVDFYLNDGTFVSGKVISEDRNKIVVEEVQEGGMAASVYGKREIDSRTLRTKGLLEYKYYLDLAEHFTARTWDFQNDPDDFIQAIRCYEKAKELLANTERQDTETIQINEKIKQLQADREVWTRQAESRAQLKKLEFEATFEKRLKDLESKLDTISQQLDKSMQQLDTTVVAVQDNYQKLETNVSSINENITQQLRDLENRVADNERLIDRRWWTPGYYYRYRTRDSESGGTGE
jgi:flagellin-like hook-associated protein FlgL